MVLWENLSQAAAARKQIVCMRMISWKADSLGKIGKFAKVRESKIVRPEFLILHHAMENPESSSVGSPSNEELNWAMAAHLASLLGYLIPLANIIAPIVVWQTKKETMPFAVDQAKESLNFQITITLLAFISLLLCLVLIGFVLLPLVGLYWLAFSIIGGLKAKDGVAYRYPFTFRFVK